MAFKTPLRHRGLAAGIAGTARASAAQTGAQMRERLAPYLREGETLPDAELLQELLGRYLEAQGAELMAASEAYRDEIRGHRLKRLELEQAKAEARANLRAFRLVMDRHLGPGHCALALGTRLFNTKEAARLVSLARAAAAALLQPGFRYDGASPLLFDGDLLSQALEASARRLEEIAQGEVLQLRARRGVELGNQAARLAETRLAISEGAALLKGLLTFTGNGVRARRLLPSHKKKGGPPG